MEKQMVMEYLLIRMGLCIVDNGRMINSMAKELNHGTIIKLNLSASFKMVKKLEMENLNLLVVFTKEILSDRAAFIEKVWNNGALLSKINESLVAKGLEKVEKEDIFGFLNNIGGNWVCEKIGNIYRKHIASLNPPELETPVISRVINPYKLNDRLRAKCSQRRQASQQCLESIWNKSLEELRVLEPGSPENILAERATGIADLYNSADNFFVPLEQLQPVLFSYNVRDTEHIMELHQAFEREVASLSPN